MLKLMGKPFVLLERVIIWAAEHNYRVGSHMVSVRIHCTEKWRTSFQTDVLSKSK